jgi:hypothetical protein
MLLAVLFVIGEGIAMNQLHENESRIFYSSWWQLVARVLDCQWKLLAGQYDINLTLLAAVLQAPTSTPAHPVAQAQATSPRAAGLRRLERYAAERARQGLAPPKEIYQMPYRNRIDWSQFPEWARPSDPELFEGCGHEG